jgi:hypothetical protein
MLASAIANHSIQSGMEPVLETVAISDEKLTCPNPSFNLHTSQITGGCVSIKFSIPGCPANNIFGADRCMKKNNYTSTVSIAGESWSRIPLKDSTTDLTGNGGVIRVTYDQSQYPKKVSWI